MLIEFSVSNFRSIRQRQTLSLSASADTTDLARNLVSTQTKSVPLLRSAVIYGPNAAGKSNILRAVETLRQLVMQSAANSQEGAPIPVVPFLLSEASSNEASEFEVVFTADDEVRYHYCCSVNAKRVLKEWLIAYPQGRPQRWFEREFLPEKNEQQWWFGPNFKADRAERKVWQDFTRDNALFLSTAIQLNNVQLRSVFTWITQKLIVLIPGVQWNPGLSLELLNQNEGQEKIMRFMRAADVGIDRIELKEEEFVQQSNLTPVPAGSMRIKFEVEGAPGQTIMAATKLRVLAWHKQTDTQRDVALDLGDESDGTRKLFEFAGGWLHALASGATLFVDELDRSLHPHMTRFLVGLFNSPANEKNAQLVFTTHDTTLLDPSLIRRDQVWFVEKDNQKSTRLYPLLEYSPRKDEALERGYLKGRYGAIPFIGALEY